MPKQYKGKGAKGRFNPTTQNAIQQALDREYFSAKEDELTQRQVVDFDQAFAEAQQGRLLIERLQRSGKYGTKSIKNRENDENLQTLTQSITSIFKGIEEGKESEVEKAIKSLGVFLQKIELTPKIKDTLYRNYTQAVFRLSSARSMKEGALLRDLAIEINKVIPVGDITPSQMIGYQQLLPESISTMPELEPTSGTSSAPPTKTQQQFQEVQSPSGLEPGMTMQFANDLVRRGKLLVEDAKAQNIPKKDIAGLIRNVQQLERLIEQSRGKALTTKGLAKVKELMVKVKDGIETYLEKYGSPTGRGRGRKMTFNQFKKKTEQSIRGLVRSVKGTNKMIQDAIVKEIMTM